MVPKKNPISFFVEKFNIVILKLIGSGFEYNILQKHLEMEPSISTPLLHEAKRKNNEMDSIRRRKKPRRKLYRPKVIGEGRKSKPKGSNMPTKQKQVTPTPNPKPKTQKIVLEPHKNNQFLEDDDQFNIIVSCKNLVAVENELECEKVIEEVEAMDSFKDLVLVENEIENHSVEEDKSTFIERLDRTFYLPKECKRKRSSKKMLALRSKERRGLTNKLLPFVFMKRKRSPTIRRFNVASLIHSHGSKETKNFNGNDIAGFGSQIKRHRAQANFNNGSTKIEETACRSPTNLKANGRDTSARKGITDGNFVLYIFFVGS